MNENNTNNTNNTITRDELVEHIFYELFEGSHRVFLTGGAGTGKSTLVKGLMEKSLPILTSTTGVSAVNINGQTTHSFFKLGISSSIEELKSSDKEILKKFRMRNINRYLSKMIKSLQKADFIVIDEVSMLNSSIMDMIMYRLEQANAINKPILFTGDLLQLPPVQGECILDSDIFMSSTIFNLNTIYRTTDPAFIEFSNNIRMGVVNQHTIDYLKSKKYTGQSLNGYVQIYPTIKEVQYQNLGMLAQLKTESVIYTPEVNKKGNKIYPKEIDTFMSNAKISNKLELKVGAQVIITRNNVCEDYVNGDVAIIEKLNSKSVLVKLERDSTMRLISYIEFDSVEYKDVGGKLEKTTKLSVKALPIMLGWAITIHKSQGAGIEKLYVKTSNLFAQSQFYVAISRSSAPEHLIIDYEDDDGLNHLSNTIPYINKGAESFYRNLPQKDQYP